MLHRFSFARQLRTSAGSAAIRGLGPQVLLALVGLLCCGCPQYADPTAPNDIRTVREPTSRRDYLIYAPTRYAADKPTALVILCHGTTPWDSARRQMGDWVKLAEEENFIVAAPHLVGTRGDLPPPAARQVERQRQDEDTILAAVRHIRGAFNIREDRIFLSGWSAGNYAVLYTGLKHPEIFRGLAVLQGNFNSAYLSEAADGIDPYQPVLVLYGSLDLIAAEGRSCVRWLYDRNAYVFEDEVPGSHQAHPREAFEFFQKIIGEVPWMQVRVLAAAGDDPRTVDFAVSASFEPTTYAWSFGDGDDSPVARPRHTYARDGEYVVTLVATTPAGARVKRVLRVAVPQQRLFHRLGD